MSKYKNKYNLTEGGAIGGAITTEGGEKYGVKGGYWKVLIKWKIV
jgi:hypothetical protein